jgi:UDP-2,3-diacylglucosamine hydrolase
VSGLAIARPDIGLMAGWGKFPMQLAESLTRQGYAVHCVGLSDHADPALAEVCESFTWCGLTKWGRAIRFFKSHGANDALMAGKVFKVRLMQPWRWVRFLPDWRTLCALPRILRRDGRDDTLLTAIVNEFARDGVRFLPATDLAPELLVKAGQLTRRGLSASQRLDVEFGWMMAKEMGRLDVGQSVLVKERLVLAVEAIEGTDECIRRAGQLCPSGGFTLVKVAKPQQDMRFDVPTIGLGTLETLRAAGGKVLAVEAGRTIILDEPEVIRFANQHGMSIVSLAADAAGLPIAAA